MIWEAIKWTFIVLVTGFIAYIGRFGAQWLIERSRQKDQFKQKPETDQMQVSHELAKLEKKKAKAAIKAEKKK